MIIPKIQRLFYVQNADSFQKNSPQTLSVQRNRFLFIYIMHELCCDYFSRKTLTMIAANFQRLKILVPIFIKNYAAKIKRGKSIFAGSMSEITFFQRFSSEKSFLDILKMSFFVFAADFFCIFGRFSCFFFFSFPCFFDILQKYNIK